ncbi:MAG: hypothetical protein WBE97_01105 [Candidatus Acidiferrales bacterium]
MEAVSGTLEVGILRAISRRLGFFVRIVVVDVGLFVVVFFLFVILFAGVWFSVVRVQCAAKNFVQTLVAFYARDFVLDVGNILLKQLADVREHGSVARGNAILRDGFEEVTERVIEVGAGAELATESGELVADAIGVDKLLFLPGMEKAITAVPIPAGHGAGTGVGESELAGGAGFLFGRESRRFCGGPSGHDFSLILGAI